MEVIVGAVIVFGILMAALLWWGYRQQRL